MGEGGISVSHAGVDEASFAGFLLAGSSETTLDGLSIGVLFEID